MTRKKKICLVIPSLQAGGMERVMSELATYFAKNDNIEVHLILYGITREVFYKIPASLKVHNPRFEFNDSQRITSTLKTLVFLRQVIKKLQPDTILSFGEYWNSFVLIALFALKYPVFISDRCQPDKRLGGFHECLRKILYPRATGIIAQTEKAKEIYQIKFNNHSIKVIGNPIREINQVEGIIREKIVLTVGRLISTKHHDKLMEIFLRINMSGWTLIIIGYDHLKQKNSDRLNKIIADNNAEDKVILPGKQPDVESWYLRSSIFAFTSSSEGFPNAIGEAMSAGMPVIAYDCVAGPSEMIIDNETGFLVPLFNEDQFLHKLKLLMENEKLRLDMGRKGRENIKQFSIERIGKETLAFILADHLTQNTGSRPV